MASVNTISREKVEGLWLWHKLKNARTQNGGDDVSDFAIFCPSEAWKWEMGLFEVLWSLCGLTDALPNDTNKFQGSRASCPWIGL